MAKETIVRLRDDIDGDEAVETLTFGLRDDVYEIDLNERNIAAIERIFDRYTKAGHRVVHHRAPRGSVKRASKNASAAAPREVAAIRDWAIASGYNVSSRGRIPAEVRAAYEAAP